MLLVGGLSAGGVGCTEQHHVVAGPAVAYPAGRPVYGGAVSLGHGTGSGNGKGDQFHTLGVAARAVVTQEHAHVRGGPSLQIGHWTGPGRLLLEGTVPVALGVERFETRFQGSLGSGLALRVGYPLTDRSTYVSPMFFPDAAVTNEHKRQRRDRTMLLAGPSADIDFRFAGQPLPTLSFFVGIMWLSESIAAEKPLPPLRPSPAPPR